MREFIGYITGLASVLLVLLGLIISMCDTADLESQVRVMLMGAGIMIVGAIFGFISMGVSNDDYPR